MTTAPIDLGDEGDQVFLTLFATGIRNRSDLASISATIGGESIPVRFGGEQGQFVGLDQLDIGPLPRALMGLGPATILVTVYGRVANALSINVE